MKYKKYPLKNHEKIKMLLKNHEGNKVTINVVKKVS